MSPRPRLLAVMGSGETAPTMTAVHRSLFARVAGDSGPAVLLDTPFGFQRNADELTERAVRYFRESVGEEMAVASLRRASAADALAVERLRLQLRDARLVFAGPGSPSYALRQWVGSPVPNELTRRLTPGGDGGCVTFASAAALTLGVATVPVYEIYKVGADPQWLTGLDLMAVASLPVAVIPHFDNTEGRSHDTRFCYLGEERLRAMEAELAPGTFVLGIDEHTAAIFDLDAATVTVAGRGGLTVRAQGRSRTVGSGTTMPTAHLAEMADDLLGSEDTGGARITGATAATGATADEGRSSDGAAPARGAPARAEPESSPMLHDIARLESDFSAAVASRDSAAAVRCILDLEEELHAWSADTLQSDEADRGRSTLRGMIVRLGDAAAAGLRDPRGEAAPWVDALLAMRTSARTAGRWADADLARDRLVSLGVEVHDSPQGTSWDLTAPARPPVRETARPPVRETALPSVPPPAP